MSTAPVNASGNSANPPPATNSTDPSTLNSTEFLTLLTTELQNQNPTNPVDDTQSVAQLAQFTSVQATQQLSAQFSAFESNFAVLQSAGLLGQNVSVSSPDATGNSSTITGTVSGISVVNGVPEFTLKDSSGQPVADSNGNPIEFTTAQITGINAAVPPAGSGTGG